MRSILATLLLLLSGNILVKAQNMVTIKGTVKGDLKGYTAVYIQGNEQKQDTAYIKNGSFEFNIPFVSPFMPAFYTEYDVKVKGFKTKSSYRLRMMVDRPGTIFLNDADIEVGLYSGKISGLKSATDYYQYLQGQIQLNKEMKEQLRKKYGDSITRKSANYDAYVTESNNMYALQHGKVVQRYLKENPDAYFSGFILDHFKTYMKVGELEKTYQLLSKNLRESETGKAIADYIIGAKKSGIGQVVSDFTINDANDQPFSFSQLKGKYILIDFWASWCSPCIASFPHLKELYKKYRSNDFEFYSISIDKSKLAWLNELKKQELPWLQGRDDNGLHVTSFAVNAVPTTILIDPEGKILLKEEGSGPTGNGHLEKKLIELFGDK